MVTYKSTTAPERDAAVIALGEAFRMALLFGSLAAKIDDDDFLQGAETHLLAAVRTRLAIHDVSIEEEAEAAARIITMIRDLVALAREDVAAARRLEV